MKPLTEAEKETLLTLARHAMEQYVREKRTLEADGGAYAITEGLREKRAAFVTLKKGPRLRGCIGHITAVSPLYLSVVENAVAAAVRDPRFPPVSREELKEVDIDISALTAPEEVPSAESFIVGRHGIIIEKGFARAVFLPQVAPEQGWGREETLSHLCRKAGLPADEWKKPGMRFSVFEAEVFGEKDEGKDSIQN